MPAFLQMLCCSNVGTAPASGSSCTVSSMTSARSCVASGSLGKTTKPSGQRKSCFTLWVSASKQDNLVDVETFIRFPSRSSRQPLITHQPILISAPRPLIDAHCWSRVELYEPRPQVLQLEIHVCVTSPFGGLEPNSHDYILEWSSQKLEIPSLIHDDVNLKTCQLRAKARKQKKRINNWATNPKQVVEQSTCFAPPPEP